MQAPQYIGCIPGASLLGIIYKDEKGVEQLFELKPCLECSKESYRQACTEWKQEPAKFEGMITEGDETFALYSNVVF